MEDSENYVSFLPQPSKIGPPSPHKGLTEISSSANNVRNKSMLPAPQAMGHKRHGSNLPEPAPKRKTLVERAGEPLKQNLAAPKSFAPVNHAVTSTIHNRNQSTSSFSQSYRSNSTASRTISNTSFSTSVGSGLRAPAPPVSGLARPKTSLAKERNAKATVPRPTTSMDIHDATKDKLKPKRTLLIFATPSRSITPIPVPKDFLFARKRKTPGRRQAVKRSQSPPSTPTMSLKRNVSLVTAFSGLSLDPTQAENDSKDVVRDESPSRIPLLAKFTPKLPRLPPDRPHFSPPPFPKLFYETPSKSRRFLTKYSNTVAWDPEEQYGNIERMYQDVCHHYKEAMEDNVEFKEAANIYKTTISSLEQERIKLTETIISLRSELESSKYCLTAAERSKEEIKRDFEEEIETLKRQFRMDTESNRQASREDIEQLKTDQKEEVRNIKNAFETKIENERIEHCEETRKLKAKLEDELEIERNQRIQALSQLTTQGAIQKQQQQMELETKNQEIRLVKAEVDRINDALQREKTLNDDLRQSLMNAGSAATSMETARQALQAKIEFLESDSKSQSEAYASMEKRMNEAIKYAEECQEKLRKEETLRRKLHNQVQELKGNIRVFCRVRPTRESEDSEEVAKITFPDTEDSKDIEVRGMDETNALGKDITKTHPFSFDRVFDPSSSNGEIFEEIGQLIQSALDGFNVCIFAYGQTGSGKTYTMSSEDGMIPRALRQIYNTSKELESRGWKYSMEGSFVEVYNEEIRDLLGKEGEQKKHEIRHDMLKCETTITDVISLSLDSQEQVEGILTRAMAKRSVAATKANEHSSRSHSVFILKLTGHNSITGEKSKGTLNLVDLAGSERLSHSKVEGARLKETQNINKSLSCLGDVIGALGQQQSSAPFNPKESVNGTGNGAAHIPYRNSKLTYLLQFSLGGNSKTLMFVMVAPEKKCLSETITSLKFADKVSRTRIGVAKKAK